MPFANLTDYFRLLQHHEFSRFIDFTWNNELSWLRQASDVDVVLVWFYAAVAL